MKRRILGLSLGNIERHFLDPFNCRFEIIFWYKIEQNKVRVLSINKKNEGGSLLATFGSLPKNQEFEDVVACIKTTEHQFNNLSVSRWEWPEMQVLATVLEKLECQPSGEILIARGTLPFMIEDELADILYDVYVKTVPSVVSLFADYGIDLSPSLILNGRNSVSIKNHRA